MTDREQLGRENVRKIFGDAGELVMNRVGAVSPDIARFIYEWAYADIYSRVQLNLRDRSIATIAGLTALNTAPTQLRAHIHGGLNVGLSKEEILEVILHMALYAGFPATQNALFIAGEEFAQREESGKG